MIDVEKLYGVFFYDADASEDERYKWSQAESLMTALNELERCFPNMPKPFALRMVEGTDRLIEVVAEEDE